MKKNPWLALALVLALVFSCGSGALAAFDAETVTAEAVMEANGRSALLAAHESTRLDIDSNEYGTMMVYCTGDYYFYQSDDERLHDAAGTWKMLSDESGRYVLYEWDAMEENPDEEPRYLSMDPVFNMDTLLSETIEAVHDNGDGTLTVTLLDEAGSLPEYLEELGEDASDVAEDAPCKIDILLDAETLEIRSYEQYGLRQSGERIVFDRCTVTVDAPEPETAVKIRAASAAFRAGAPENPRTITVIYNPGEAFEQTQTLVADESFKVHPNTYFGYELLYTDPERTEVFQGTEGVTDVTIYAFAYGAYLYEHDPRLNPRVLADALADESAVYGFRPSETGSLAQYADADWSDPELVAGGRADRIAYHESMGVMYDMLDEMRAAGEDIETIARAVSAKRNELRLAACTSAEELAAAKARNLEKYGHEEGPLPDEMFEKYGSWETVLVKAFSPNAAMDACLGLYDDYYDLYLAAGWLTDESATPCERQYAVAAFVDGFYPWDVGTEEALAAFADAGEIGDCYLPEWEWAVESGLVKGYEDGTLRPTQTIRRIEAFVLLSRCLPELEATGEPVAFSDVPDWAKADIDRLSAAGLLLGYGDGTLGAEDVLTVEQVYTVLQRAAA